MTAAEGVFAGGKWVAAPLRWYVFGVHADGTVDVVDEDGDVMIGVSRMVADKCIAARDRMIALWVKARSDDGR